MSDDGSSVILAIQASGPEASIAVGRGESVGHLEAVSNAARHDDDLMPAVARAFQRISAAPSDLSMVCVSVGPGGFTGLRIAISTAKSLVFALQCKLVAVPETMAVAEAVGGAMPLAICLAGKHGDYWTAFHSSGQTSDGQILTVQEIVSRAAALGSHQIAICQPPERLADLGSEAAAAGCSFMEVHPNASHILEVGRRLAAAGHFASAEGLAPIYPREPEAVRLWRQRRG